MSALKIQRSVALAVFEFCGWKSAANWDNARMAKKLSDVKDVLPEKDIPENLKSTITDILTTTTEAGDFEVIADSEETETSADTGAETSDGETSDAPKKLTKEEKAAAKAATKELADKQKADKKAADAAAKTAAKAEKAVKAPKEPKPPKEVKEKDPKNNRIYCAALVLREFGSLVEPENTKSIELATKVDELTGRPNTRESLGYLKVARKCIAGWLAGTPPEDAPDAEKDPEVA